MNTDLEINDSKEIQHFSNIPGMEGVESDMIIIPRLKLVQKTSEEIMEFDFKPGTFCDSVTKEIVGDAPKQAKDGTSIELIPVFVSGKSRLYFKDFAEGGGLLCQSKDGRTGSGDPGGTCKVCTLKDWKNNESPKCSEYINVFFFIPSYDSPIPLVVNFGKSSMPAGKKLINFLYMKQKEPWAYKFELSSYFVSSEKGDHFVMKIKPSGKSSKEQMETSEGFYHILSKLKYEIDNMESDHVAESKQNTDDGEQIF